MTIQSSRAMLSVIFSASWVQIATLGCGPEGPRTYPVTGTVVYKGKGDIRKLEGGYVILESVSDPTTTASGEIEEGGSFTIGSRVNEKDRTGAPAGEYRVSIRPPHEGDGGEAARRAGFLHPRYLSPRSSRLVITVTTGRNTPTIEVEAGR